jgi:hypothetical protein
MIAKALFDIGQTGTVRPMLMALFYNPSKIKTETIVV